MKTNDSQDLTLNLLIILGVVLVMVSAWGDFFQSIIREITTPHQMNLNFNPLNQGGSKIIPGTGIAPASSQSSTSLYNVPIQDASGGVGTIQVVAQNAQSAMQNATQGNNTPIGSPTLV